MDRKLLSNDIITMKAMPIHEGLRLTKEKGWTNIIIESALEVVIQQITGGTTH